MRIPDAKAAIDKEWEKLEKLPAWQMTKVKSKKEVIHEAQNEGRTVRSLCYADGLRSRQKLELDQKFQKYKGGVVLRGDIVKDESGSYTVFAEQGSSESRMTAAKSNGRHRKATRMCTTGSRRSIRLHPGETGRCTIVIENSQVRMSRHLDTSTTTQVAKIMVQHGRSSRSF